MTRKDYVLLAAELKAQRKAQCTLDPNLSACCDAHARAVADVLKRENAAFDRERFLKACGVS